MYLGIDLGTSSMKCLIIGDDQEIIYNVSSKDISLTNPKSGWSEQDPSLWIEALELCLAKLKEKVKLNEIKSISFSGHMHGATCIDKNHEVIRPCILWNDTRSHQECKDIMNDKSVMDIAGNIAMPGFTAPKVLWLKNNEFEKYKFPNFNNLISTRTRATLQIQQGCDHRCTFCIIPFGRGDAVNILKKNNN